MNGVSSVLIVDDDPTHLRTYGWIIQAAGRPAFRAEVRFDRVNLPADKADLVLLDYQLGRRNKAVEVAKLIHEHVPGVPLLVLSEVLALPEDVAPLVQGCVRKGDPPKLLAAIGGFLAPFVFIKPEVFGGLTWLW
jgi:DNA-binding response OmpR family regulator